MNAMGSSVSPCKVLIVDDEPSIVTPLKFLMEQQGHAVRIVTDGAEVVPAVEADPPDVILLDVNLPNRSGYDLCETIRNEPAWSDVRIVLLTVKSREVDVEKGRALGADAYITKPFAIQDVVNTVNDLIG